MSTLILDRRDQTLTLRDGQLTVRSAGQPPARLPLGRIERIVITQTTGLDSTTLANLWAAGIVVQILGGRRAQEGPVILPPAHRDSSVRLQQSLLVADAARRDAAATLLLRAKMTASRRLLSTMLRTRPDQRLVLTRARATLAAIHVTLTAQPPAAAGLLGLEGAAAAAEMAALAAVLPPRLGFARRQRRPPPDPANAVLSLLATLATAEAARIAWSCGLDPALGVLHVPVPGRPALACDLVEPLRPALTRLTWRLFADEILRPERFEIQSGGACLLGKAGRAAFYEVWEAARPPLSRRLETMARALVRHLRAQPLPWGPERLALDPDDPAPDPAAD